MNNSQHTGATNIPLIIQIPGLPVEGEFAETINEFKQIVAELREIRESSGGGFAQVSWSEDELAEYFGIAVKSLRELRNAGKIKFKRVKGKIHYSRRHVEEYLNSPDPITERR